MIYDSRYFRKAHKKLLPEWFWLYEIEEVFATNNTYFLRNLDGTNYPDRVNHDKLKKAYVDLSDWENSDDGFRYKCGDKC